MAGKDKSFSLKPCGTKSTAEQKAFGGEEDALVWHSGSGASALKPCSHRGGSKNLDGFSLKPCTTTSTAAAVAFAGKEFQFKQRTTQSMEDTTGEQECSLKICSTKRKVPADGHDEEDTVLADSTIDETKEQATKVAVADSDDGSSDDEPLSEAEHKAFIEGLREKHRKFWREEFLPLNPLLKHYSLKDEEEVCNNSAKGEAALESN